jgi:glycosyl transferase, family 8
MSNITIVLAADTGYAEQVHTLMKSICTHNTMDRLYQPKARSQRQPSE